MAALEIAKRGWVWRVMIFAIHREPMATDTRAHKYRTNNPPTQQPHAIPGRAQRVAVEDVLFTFVLEVPSIMI